jgi:hypothetical protein
MDAAIEWKKVQAQLSTFAELGITYNYTHDLEASGTRPLLRQLSTEEITTLDVERTKLKKTPWIEQAREESGELHPVVDAETEDGVNSGHSDDDSQQEIWKKDRFACRLCEQGKLGPEVFIYGDMPGLFHHLRNA